MSAVHDTTGTGKGSSQELEALPADVLLAVLSASHNTGDLYSLVRSSRPVYEVFRSAKRTVLISIVARDLGWSGLRTATAATLITAATFRRGARYEGDAKPAIKLYESIVHDPRGLSFARGMSEAEVAKLVRINRGVQFLVDHFLRVMASFVFPSCERIPRSLWGVYLTGREWWRDSDEQEAMGDLGVMRARFLEKLGHKPWQIWRWKWTYPKASGKQGMNWARLVVRQWRWLGFMFWDKERIELLKSKLPKYATGWLTRPPACDDNLSFEGF
ncbi:hypothetical protein V2G26_013368 [Clonostachys chloroleuca]